MVFSSATFIFIFLPLIMAIYLVTPKKFKNLVLFVSGLLFYAWGEFAYVYFILITTVVDFVCGFLIDKYREQFKKKKLFLLTSLIINFGLLSVFKYSGFVVSTINAVFKTSIPDPNLPLPIGISFYTFCSATYVLDVYMTRAGVEKSFIDYASYVTMFPKVLMGPIVQYGQIRGELKSRTVSFDKISYGTVLFIQGLAKKMLLSDTVGALWFTIKGLPVNELSVGMAWLGILAYAFNIYLDFSGYTDMARGLGYMLGFEFPINFDYPYLAVSISDFWRRWHITLGSWFREYIYIPLGGNRVSKAKNIRNLLVVWMLTGLWHGASWNFVLWGLYFGILLIFEKFFFARILDKLPIFVRRIYSFFLILIGWVLFDFSEMSQMWKFFGAMFGANGVGVLDGRFWYYVRGYALIFILCITCSGGLFKRAGEWIRERFKSMYIIGEPIVYISLFLICISYLVEATNTPFLYFKF